MTNYTEFVRSIEGLLEVINYQNFMDISGPRWSKKWHVEKCSTGNDSTCKRSNWN